MFMGLSFIEKKEEEKTRVIVVGMKKVNG